MRKILVGAALGAALALVAPTAEAGSQAPATKKQVPKTSKRASAKRGKTFDLHGMRWYHGLDAAGAHRKAAKRPILWMRVLGDATGKT